MSRGRAVIQGEYGRVALLDINAPVLTHAHPHCHVLVKVSGADSVFRVKGRDYPLNDQTVVVVNSWEPHAYPHLSGAQRSVVLALYISTEWLKNIDKDFAVSSDRRFFSRPCFELTSALRRLVDEMAWALSFAEDSSRRNQERLLDLVVAVIETCSDWRALRRIRGAGHWAVPDFRIRRGIDFMQENIGTSFTFDDVARAAGLSRPHFFALFKENTNLTPNVFYSALRMEAAYESLPLADRPITNISGELGFAAQSHFTRFFRNNLGIPPSEYRRVLKRGLVQEKTALAGF